MNPATRKAIWSTGLPNDGILGLYSNPGNAKSSGQPIFSDGYLIESRENGITAFTP